MRMGEIKRLCRSGRLIGDENVSITGISMDTRKVEKGDLFVCVPGIPGFLADRHPYAKEAVERGAVALVAEREMDVSVPVLLVKDARQAMAVISSAFYNHPSRDVKMMGITGTNGKTTTAHIAEHLFASHGYKTGLMGNNGIKIGGVLHSTDLNTQEPPVLQRRLAEMRACGTDYCFMEVTSQGLDMGRAKGVRFQGAAFTNLTQDHLDYHGDFASYREAKGLFFSRLGSGDEGRYAVLNADDEASCHFAKGTACEVLTYGIECEADVMAHSICTTSSGTTFWLRSIWGEGWVEMPLIGTFNVYNALAAITMALAEGIPIHSVCRSLQTLPQVRGRMEVVDKGQGFLALVDYAHTPDALESVLGTIHTFSSGRILTVFGCGGDRDRGKRSVMGRIAIEKSDVVIVTSDNPRTEDPQSIASDISEGMTGVYEGTVEMILDRKEAIERAVTLARPGDVLVVAGKGHETVQIIGDRTSRFDDREEIEAAIKRMG